MITDDKAKEQLARMSQLDGFPRDKGSFNELKYALMVCETPGEATKLIDDIMQTVTVGQKCPYPADIRRMAYDRAARVPEPAVKHKCSRCQDCGIFGGEISGKFAGPWKWCDCATAQTRMAIEPNIIVEANQAREKLVRMNLKGQARQRAEDRPMRSLATAIEEDSYAGEF